MDDWQNNFLFPMKTDIMHWISLGHTVSCVVLSYLMKSCIITLLFRYLTFEWGWSILFFLIGVTSFEKVER